AHDREERRSQKRERAHERGKRATHDPEKRDDTADRTECAARRLRIDDVSLVRGRAHDFVSLRVTGTAPSCACASSSSPCAAAGSTFTQPEIASSDRRMNRRPIMKRPNAKTKFRRGTRRRGMASVPPGMAVTEGLRNSTVPSSGSSKAFTSSVLKC